MSMWVKSEWRGPLVASLVSAASREAAQDAAEEVLELANEHVPFDTGHLMDTGSTDVGQAREAAGSPIGGQFASGWESTVSYDTPYAIPLHEHPEFEFQGEGEGKWLERAVNQAEGNWPTQLAPPLVAVFRLP